MNICFFLISDGWGGAEYVLYNLAKYTAKKGHEVSIILNEETYSYFKDLNNIDIHNIGPVFDHQKFMESNFNLYLPQSLMGHGILGKAFRFIFGPILEYLNYKKVKPYTLNLIKKIEPDVINFHNPVVLEIYSMIYKYINKPTFYTYHGMGGGKIMNPIKRNIFADNTHLLKGFDLITAVSKAGAEQLNVKETINIIPNGFDYLSLKELRSNTENNGKHKRDIKIMFPGGMKPNKGGLLILKAFKIMNKKNLPISLYFAGKLNQKFVEENLVDNVEFIGLQNHQEYLKKLNKSDSLILASVVESFPISILEAMGLGKSIITTPVGGIPEFCKNNKNALYIKRDPKDIANKIIHLYENPELRKELCRNNIEDAKKYDWNNIVDKYLASYRSILKEIEVQ